MNNQQPGYSLPGIVHYLQTEWTRNEKDRIQWANEREEMKAAISKLQSENDRLKRQLQNHSADSIKPVSNGDKLIDFAPLVKARQHLKTRMDEVMFLLRGTDDNSDLVGVREYVAVGTRENKRLIHPKKIDLHKGSSPAIVETLEIDQDETDPEVETECETIIGDLNEDSEPFPQDENSVSYSTESEKEDLSLIKKLSL